MSEPNERAEQVALFRYGVIADLVHLDPQTVGLYERIRHKSEQSWTIPHSRKSRIAAETIRHWLKLYRKGGFDALRPKVRKDAGCSRRLPQHAVDLLLTLKEQHPRWSVKQVIAEAKKQQPDDVRLAFSTVHRLLQRNGLMHISSPEQPVRDRRRFSFAHAGQLWMSDVMHGPAIVEQGRRKKKTYLIAFIDDATRVVPYAAFCRRENTAAFLPVLKQALMRRGIPERLYVDNGAAYRSKHLQLVCAQLGITLIHTRPYDAAAKGKQERWFRTVRMQLLPTLSESDLDSLGALNRRLWAWVETEYHLAPHRGIDGLTPFDRWAQCPHNVRMVTADVDLDALFLFEARRKVYADRTISLDGKVYEVQPHLVGQTVTVRYDPLVPPGRPLQIWFEGKRTEDATLVDAYQNCFVKRCKDDHARWQTHDPSFTVPPSGLSLSALSDADKEVR